MFRDIDEDDWEPSIDNTSLKTFEVSDAIVGNDGWLSPEGKFYTCTSVEHDACARFIVPLLDQKFVESHRDLYAHTLPPARNILQRAGYLQLSKGAPVAWSDHPLTEKQIEALKAGGIIIPLKLRIDFEILPIVTESFSKQAETLTDVEKAAVKKFLQKTPDARFGCSALFMHVYEKDETAGAGQEARTLYETLKRVLNISQNKSIIARSNFNGTDGDTFTFTKFTEIDNKLIFLTLQTHHHGEIGWSICGDDYNIYFMDEESAGQQVGWQGLQLLKGERSS